MSEQSENPSRRHFLAAAAATAVAAAAAPADASRDGESEEREEDRRRPRRANDVILVHGAFADASSWLDVIQSLQADGFNVRAVQLPFQGLAGDIAAVQRAIAQTPRPLVVAAHSYGGAVISGIRPVNGNVIGLVFAAGYALDRGESLLDQNGRFPATPGAGHVVFDDQGGATLDEAGFVGYFAPDIPRRRARALFAVQKPNTGAAFVEKGGDPSWRSIPSYYQVSRDDQLISPELERFNARRMGARTIELPSSHASPLSHPEALAALIRRAARG